MAKNVNFLLLLRIVIFVLIKFLLKCNCSIQTTLPSFELNTESDIIEYDKPDEKPIKRLNDQNIEAKKEIIVNFANENESIDNLFDEHDEQINEDKKMKKKKLNNNEIEKKNFDDLLDKLKDFTNDEIKNNTFEENKRDDYEISENKTIDSILKELNVTSLTRMIDLAEQGNLNLLNKKHPRRIQIDSKMNYDNDEDNDVSEKLMEKDFSDFYDIENLKAPSVEECGCNRFDNEIPLTERIIGGNNTLHGEFPWQVSIRLTHPYLGQVGHWCGGVLISLQWVLTASHCFINPLFQLPEPVHWQIRLGKYNIRKSESTEKTYQVSKLFYLKQYHAYDNDLAILKIKTKVEETEFIKPICLPLNGQFNFSNHECYVTGWGKVDYDKKGSDVMQKVKVRIYDNLDCHKVYYPKFKINIKNWHLCAGNKSGGKGTCHGDSGGPLQCKIGNKWHLAGITSFGSNCAKFGFPDVFTKITHFLDWIKEKMKNE